MNVFMIGGTGFLGFAGAKELIRRGHFVKAIVLPPKSEDIKVPKEMTVIFQDFTKLSSMEMKSLMIGCDALVFAAGIDERKEHKRPIYEAYNTYNIEPIKKLFLLAKQIGIKKFVVLGSYFSYFAKKLDKLHLNKNHPYIKSRIEQEKVALSFADKETSVAILELPYIFGIQKGRKPVWVFLVDIIKNKKLFTFYPKGGTAMITIKQAGQFIADSVEKNVGGNAYPIGYYNLSWRQMLTIFQKYMNIEKKHIINTPKFIFKLSMIKLLMKNKKNNIESGFNLFKLSDIMYNNFFITKEELSPIFNISDDNIENAIGQSVQYSLEVLSGRSSYLDLNKD